jgi:aerobic carbon-monoxide dehydrogenase medium subunit
MKPARFDYVRPQNLAEAIATLQRDDKTSAVLAGGQSLIVLLGLRVASFDLLVDVGRIAELQAVDDMSDRVFLGAATTHAAIEDGKVPDPSGGLMRDVAANIAYRAVRNHGTIGGSIALADPAADWPACLMALGATCVVRGPRGTRTQAVVDFIRGPYDTTLAPGEIITGFDIRKLNAGSRSAYAKVARKSGAFATSIAAVVDRAEGTPPVVVLGGTGSRAQVLPTVGNILLRTRARDEPQLRSAIARDLAAVEPTADAYQQRLHTATVLRAIREAFAP